MSATNKSLILRLSGGLGNQLFQYAAAMRISGAGGHSIILDDSSYLRNKDRVEQLSKLGITKGKAPDWIRATTKLPMRLVAILVRAGLYKLVAGRKTHWIRNYSPNHRINPTHGVLYDYIILEGLFQNNDNVSPIITKLSDDLLVLKRRKILRQTWQPTIAIHVRLCDYIAHPTLDVCDSSYYQRAISFCKRRLPAARFILFSDNCVAAKEIIKKSDIEVFTGKSDIECFYAMSECDHFIIPNSTFSWWAARLQNTAQKIVVMPKFWYRSARADEVDMVPSGWLQI